MTSVLNSMPGKTVSLEILVKSMRLLILMLAAEIGFLKNFRIPTIVWNI
jgi:hypothetical protein